LCVQEVGNGAANYHESAEERHWASDESPAAGKWKAGCWRTWDVCVLVDNKWSKNSDESAASQVDFHGGEFTQWSPIPPLRPAILALVLHLLSCSHHLVQHRDYCAKAHQIFVWCRRGSLTLRSSNLLWNAVLWIKMKYASFHRFAHKICCHGNILWAIVNWMSDWSSPPVVRIWWRLWYPVHSKIIRHIKTSEN